jgi:hypothetical protein
MNTNKHASEILEKHMKHLKTIATHTQHPDKILTTMSETYTTTR